MATKILNNLLLLSLFSIATLSYAETSNKQINACILDLFSKKQAAEYTNLKKECGQKQSLHHHSIDHITNKGAITDRIVNERQTAYNPFVITPHKRNYILLATHSSNINKGVYNFAPWSDNFSDTEAKFQLSIKVPLNFKTLFVEGDALYLGFTLQAWWQIYSENISKPFRETNYQPEIFYLLPLNWHPKNGNTGLIFGLEHESNGRSQPLSRSWNRLYTSFLFEKDNFVFAFKPWWRLPEPKKKNPLDADGDDNPDIHQFYGHFELLAAHKWQDREASFMLRRNLKHQQGAIELNFTFPLWGRLRGYAQYFNGYGESLIDYNHRQQRLGLGIALTGIL